jgi:hypothetical protein
MSVTISKTNVHFAQIDKLKTTCVMVSFKYGGSTSLYENPNMFVAEKAKAVMESLVFKSFAETVKSSTLHNFPFACKNGVTSCNYSLGAGAGSVSVVCKSNLSAVKQVVKMIVGNPSKMAIKNAFKFYSASFDRAVRPSSDDIESMIGDLVGFECLNILIVGSIKKVDKKALESKLESTLDGVCSKGGQLPPQKNVIDAGLEFAAAAKNKHFALFPECCSYMAAGDVKDAASGEKKTKVKELMGVMSKRYGKNISVYMCALSCFGNASALIAVS